MRRRADSTQIVLRSVVELLLVVFVQRLAESLDCAQWGSQVVRDGVRECLQFLVGGLELQTAPHDFLLGFSFLGNITGDFHKAAQNTDVVTQWRNYHVCPEARAVFPYAPAIILKTSFFSGRLEFDGWFSNRNVLRRIKY